MICAPMDAASPRKSLAITLAAVASIATAHVAVQSHLVTAMLCPARDGARYIQYALRLEEERAPLNVLRTSDDHPGYPLMLRGAYWTAAQVGIDSPAARIRIAQLVSSASGLLFAFFAYLACRKLWGELAAWVAAFSLVTLARPAQTFADVLSDTPHALFWTASFLCILRGLDSSRSRWLAAAGLLGALAYWTRVDAVALVAAVGLTTGLLAARRKLSIGLALRLSGSFVVTFAMGLIGFYLACNRLSTKPVGLHFLFGEAPGAIAWPLLAIGGIAAPGRVPGAIGDYVNDLGQEVQFVHLATAGIALLLWIRARRWRSVESGDVLAALLFAIYSTLILAVDLRYGYLAGRYFLPLIPLLVGFGAHGLLRAFPGRQRMVTISIVAASLAASAPSMLKRQIHEQTHGQLEAGRWVAGRIQGEESVYDPYFFPTYLAGARDRTTKSVAPREGATLGYLILDRADLKRHPEAERWITDGSAVAVAAFPRKPGGGEALVNVYRIHR